MTRNIDFTGKETFQVYGLPNNTMITLDELKDFTGSAQGQKGEKGDKGDAGKDGRDGIDGRDGRDGSQGIRGDKGDKGDTGDKGEDGKSFHVDGTVDLLADLPDPSTVPDQYWVTYEFGKLHHSDGTKWTEVAQFVGVEGKKGDKGEKGDKGDRGERGDNGTNGKDGRDGIDGHFDIDSLAEEDAKKLQDMLFLLSDEKKYYFSSEIKHPQVVDVPIGNSNLTLRVKTLSTSTITYSIFSINPTLNINYFVKRLSVYDTISLEGRQTSGWKPQDIPVTGLVLDDSGYLSGREHTIINIIDPTDLSWYTVNWSGLGNGVMLFDVTEKSPKNRKYLTPSSV